MSGAATPAPVLLQRHAKSSFSAQFSNGYGVTVCALTARFPSIGADIEAILRERGFSAARIEELKSAGAI